MRITHLGAALAACGLASVAGAQITKSVLVIGGPGSCSSEGFNDPGLLADGVTEASATLEFTLDAGTNILQLEIVNTSPVVAGVHNPLLTDLFFNVPVEVTGMSLTNQTSEFGATPAYSFSFDGNLMANPQPNKAAPFGAFSAWLSDTGDISAAIANGDADTWSKPLVDLAYGTVTFTFDLTGDMTGVEASHFASAFSVIPPGDKPSHLAAHFQAGGAGGAYSSFINDSPEQCYAVVADRVGSETWGGPNPTPYTFSTQLSGVQNAYGTTIESPLMIPLAQKKKRFLVNRQLVESFTVQVVMYNPDVFPTAPEQSSGALRVKLYDDGSYKVTSFGSETGMSVSHELVKLPDGRRFLSFPFEIQGF